MSARELPDRPSLVQYKKQAKDLLESLRSADPDALKRLRGSHPRHRGNAEDRRLPAKIVLADAQLVIAREHGCETWAQFVARIAQILGEHDPALIWKSAEAAIVAGDVPALERLLREHERLLRKERPQSSWLGGLTPDYSGSDAQSIVVKNHHFDSWTRFAEFKEALGDPRSPVAQFEEAVDAVIHGDMRALQRLLGDNPSLIHLRSMRTHRSTLLHYVGANGVEGFRQRTPRNAVQIAETLLAAAADVDAVAEMYGGATTLGLVATSIHPKQAGLQNALIELLIGRGASLSRVGAAGNRHDLVNGCLANGRGEAAEFLARHGAPLDLEAAAGVGMIEVVRGFFDEGGGLKGTASVAQMRDGFMWACEYGRTRVVDFLLNRGVEAGTRLKHGETGLHWAALGGHLETVRLLLGRGATVDSIDERWLNTPLGWALYGWREHTATSSESYADVVSMLVFAGASVKPEWLADEGIKANAGMLQALSVKR